MREGKKTIIRKLNTSSGFTLAETLVAILILLMVSAVVAGGIPAAKNAYEKVVLASNAEVLLSTTISSLRNELGTASNVDVKGTVITYYNPSIKATSRICLNSDLPGLGMNKLTNNPDGVIVYQRYAEATVGTTESNGQSAVTRLVSEKASTQGLYATYDSVELDMENGLIHFGKSGVDENNLSVKQEIQNGTDKKITERDVLSIRLISY